MDLFAATLYLSRQRGDRVAEKADSGRGGRGRWKRGEGRGEWEGRGKWDWGQHSMLLQYQYSEIRQLSRVVAELSARRRSARSLDSFCGP